MNRADKQAFDRDLPRKCCAQMMEHFDSVQIFASRYEPEVGTIIANFGAGNWFTRAGQVREWLCKEDQRSRNEITNVSADED